MAVAPNSKLLSGMKPRAATQSEKLSIGLDMQRFADKLSSLASVNLTLLQLAASLQESREGEREFDGALVIADEIAELSLALSERAGKLVHMERCS